MKRELTLAMVALALAAFSVSPVQANAPMMINYQGRLTDAGGNPVDTTVNMRFVIYDDSTGGSPKWSEAHGAVVVIDGLFHVILGGNNPLRDTVFNQNDRFLGIAVGGDPELMPRTRLVSTGYAHRVSTIDLSTGGLVTGDVNVQSNSSGWAFEVNQAGLGGAGRFSMDNAGSTGDAVVGVTQGGGDGGSFLTEGTGNAVSAMANGTGYTVYASTNFGKGLYSGISGTIDSSTAIHGQCWAASAGDYSAAIRGEHLSTDFFTRGVWGSVEGNGFGVLGVAKGSFGTGVRGESDYIAISGNTNGGRAGSFLGGRVTISGATDATLGDGTSGYLVLGVASQYNVVFDNNEIMARYNGSDTILHLQANGGAVAIGASGLNIPAGYILAVDGKAIMEEVEVQLSNNWPDYVFNDDYQLMPLEDLEEHINADKHLPGIPPAVEIESGTLPLGEMQTKLLEKIEELTLYVIDMNKQISQLQTEKTVLEQRLLELEGNNQ